MAGTIQRIAELAGVSRGTVDRAINGRGRVNEETAARISQIADELGYVPKHRKKRAAGEQTGMPGQAKTIGVITQLCHSSFMIEVNRGISEVSAKLEKQGIRVCVKESATVDEAEQLAAIDELEREGIDALALMPVDSDGIRLRLNRLVSERKIPLVTFNSDIVGTERMCFVGIDNWKSGRTAAGLMGLMMHGKGRVLGITGYFSNGAGSRRMDGFVEELKNSFPDIGLIGVQSSFDHTQEVEKIIVDAMNAYPDLSGIFVASGGQEGVKRAFERLGPETRPYVIIYDLTPKNERYLQEGVVDFLLDQEGYLQGYRAVSLLADKLRWDKEPAEEYMYTEIRIKTKYNL